MIPQQIASRFVGVGPGGGLGGNSIELAMPQNEQQYLFGTDDAGPEAIGILLIADSGEGVMAFLSPLSI